MLSSLWQQNPPPAQESSRIWGAVPSPSITIRCGLAYGDAPNGWCTNSHEFSIWQFPKLCTSSFPPTSDSWPPPPRILRQFQGPLPLCTLPATCAAERLTPLSQLLSEVTRYFGPSDRGVNSSFHATQMRSCMCILSTNDKTLIREVQEVVTSQPRSSLAPMHSRHAIGKASLFLSPRQSPSFPHWQRSHFLDLSLLEWTEFES